VDVRSTSATRYTLSTTSPIVLRLVAVLAMNSNPSLAQFIASQGGVRYYRDASNRGEMDRVRDTNKFLRGKNSVFRIKGHPEDIACEMARSDGFNVDDTTFLALLEQDAIAWAQGSLRGRVLRDYTVDDTEYTAYYEDISAAARALMEQDCRRDAPLDYEDCYCDFVPITQLTWEIQEVLIDTLEALL
jgi:hypothetical protein